MFTVSAPSREHKKNQSTFHKKRKSLTKLKLCHYADAFSLLRGADEEKGEIIVVVGRKSFKWQATQETFFCRRRQLSELSDGNYFPATAPTAVDFYNKNRFQPSRQSRFVAP